jgi:ABC-type uncharacterized transport system substrate-binding protein
LVEGLKRRGYRFCTGASANEFVIHFHLTDVAGLSNIDTFRHAPGQNPDVIFCMSTAVVRGAGGHNLGVPIVGIVSEPQQEGFNVDPYCGVSAQRVQKAGECFNNFRRAVPALTKIFVLGNSDNTVSDRAMQEVTTAAQNAGNFPIEAIDITPAHNLRNRLRNQLPDRAANLHGLLVLPVDLFLGNARAIINIAQVEKQVPSFFPVPDWVKPRDNSALGAYGVSQRRCGVMMAEQVHLALTTGIPSGAARWIMAQEYDFDFLTSAEAATALNITLGVDPPPED